MRRPVNASLLVIAGFLGCIGLLASPIAVHAQLTLCTASSFVAGVCFGPASTSYTFTLTAFRLRRQTTNEIVPMTPASQTFNAASATAGQQVGTWASGLTVPQGKYDAFIVEMDRTFTASAPSLALTDGRTCPAANVSADISTSLPSPLPADPLFEVSGSNLKVTMTQVTGLPLDVKPGQDVEVTLKFDVGAGIQYTFPFAVPPANCTAASTAIGPLGVNMTFTLTGP